jgi:transcriptional regulator
MTEKVCLKIIANRYDSLSAVERALCDYILKNPSEVLKMTAAEFGRAAGSAPASIIRLCRDLGFEGFTDFKISLALSLGGDEALVLPEVKETDTTEEIFRKVFASGINTLNDTMKMFDVGMLDKAVDMLFGSRNIAFYGEGTSGTIARDAYHRLMRLGLPASCATEVDIMLTSALNLGQGDTAVGVSHSGRAHDTVSALRQAKAMGAGTIAITSFADSPISDYADICLVAYSDESRYPVEAVSSRIAHIAILDALSVALALRAPDRTRAHLKLMKEAFESKRISRQK